MTPFAQTLAVLLLVGVCVAYVARQALRTFAGKASKFGSCCAKGCTKVAEEQNASGAAKVQFLPLESLKRRRTN